jgi:hypothetical protein
MRVLGSPDSLKRISVPIAPELALATYHVVASVPPMERRSMRTWLLILGGILAIQVLLVWGYVAMARKSSETRTSEVVGSLLAAILVAMWVSYLALSGVALKGVD